MGYTMGTEDQIRNLLRDHGAVLVRHRRHNVWRFPDGRTIVRSKTPSDWRHSMRALTDLHHVLGVRRRRRKNHGRKRKPGIKFAPAPLEEHVEIARDWKTPLAQVCTACGFHVRATATRDRRTPR
jgi:hypothetical protein